MDATDEKEVSVGTVKKGGTSVEDEVEDSDTAREGEDGAGRSMNEEDGEGEVMGARRVAVEDKTMRRKSSDPSLMVLLLLPLPG